MMRLAVPSALLQPTPDGYGPKRAHQFYWWPNIIEPLATGKLIATSAF